MSHPHKISEVLRLRNSSTICVRGIPFGLKIESIRCLAPDAKAYRIPWLPHLHRHAGLAFIEFDDEDQTNRAQQTLDKLTINKSALSATIGQSLSTSPTDYHCNKLVLHGLHRLTGKGELARRLTAGAKSIEIVKAANSKDKQRPGLAYVTFHSPGDALQALTKLHGCVIRKHKISATFQLKHHRDTSIESSNDELTNKRPKTTLRLIGLKSSVGEADVQALFPQASRIKFLKSPGEAKLFYELEEDCQFDKQAARNVCIKGKRVRVFYASSGKGPHDCDSKPTFQPLTGPKKSLSNKSAIPKRVKKPAKTTTKRRKVKQAASSSTTEVDL